MSAVPGTNMDISTNIIRSTVMNMGRKSPGSYIDKLMEEGAKNNHTILVAKIKEG